MNVFVLRGPAGVGKSTLATAVQQALGYPTAHLDTDVLNWQFVPGEPNKHVVFEVLQQITATYLANGYHVDRRNDPHHGGGRRTGRDQNRCSIPSPRLPRVLVRRAAADLR